jgi:hypothetical protein
VVCGRALQHQSGVASAMPDAYPSCGQVTCRMVLDRRASMGDVLFRSYLARQVKQIGEQAAQDGFMQQRTALEAQENQHAWARLQASVVQPPSRTIVKELVLPSGPREQIKLTRLRRKRYRAHLQKIIAQALSVNASLTAEQATDLTPVESKLPGHLCAACGGGCCTRGGDHAYLEVATLQRFIADHPELTADQILQRYVENLAKHTQLGSCINHTRKGCSLSREMRSDICNNYICAPLATLEKAQRSAEPIHTILVVRRKLDNWTSVAPGRDNPIQALAVLTEEGVQILPEQAIPLNPTSSAQRSVHDIF